jgi:hypothetical protein
MTTTIDDIAVAVSAWAAAHKDALSEHPCVIAEGVLSDGTAVAVVRNAPFLPDYLRPMTVYRIQRDGVFGTVPFSVAAAACDDAYLHRRHAHAEQALLKERVRHGK